MAAAGSLGLTATETAALDRSEIQELVDAVEGDGGAVLGAYRDPFGATPVLVVSLPIAKVEPTAPLLEEARVRFEDARQVLGPMSADDDAYFEGRIAEIDEMLGG